MWPCMNEQLGKNHNFFDANSCVKNDVASQSVSTAIYIPLDLEPRMLPT
jgi:hypothetical protein